MVKLLSRSRAVFMNILFFFSWSTFSLFADFLMSNSSILLSSQDPDHSSCSNSAVPSSDQTHLLSANKTEVVEPETPSTVLQPPLLAGEAVYITFVYFDSNESVYNVCLQKSADTQLLEQLNSSIESACQVG